MTGQSLMVVPEELVRGIQQLEPLPLTARRLLELINGKDVSLCRDRRPDRARSDIVAAVLRSGVHGPLRRTRRLATVREAVFRLGTVALLDLVLEGYLSKLRTATPLYDLSEHDLWLHSAAAQLAVRALAAERPKAKIPAIAETAALLHDIGKLIVSRYLKADVRELVTHARTRGITFVDAEREILGVDHTTVGAAMAEAWKFPPEIVDAIRRHHSAALHQPDASSSTRSPWPMSWRRPSRPGWGRRDSTSPWIPGATSGSASTSRRSVEFRRRVFRT